MHYETNITIPDGIRELLATTSTDVFKASCRKLGGVLSQIKIIKIKIIDSC